MTNSSPQIILEGEAKDGSKIKTLYGERRVKVYPVLEAELSTVSYLNSATLVSFSLASFLIPTDTAGVFSFELLFSSEGVASLALFIFGLVAFGFRFATIHKIKKKQTKES